VVRRAESLSRKSALSDHVARWLRTEAQTTLEMQSRQVRAVFELRRERRSRKPWSARGPCGL
jgi:hypothetical protein